MGSRSDAGQMPQLHHMGLCSPRYPNPPNPITMSRRRTGIGLMIGFLAGNSNRGVIFAPATGIRCGAIRNTHNFNDL